MRRSNSNPPRIITLRYAARCGETGRALARGGAAWWIPGTRTAYALDTETARRLQADADAGQAGGDRFDMAYEDACAAACGL